MPYTFNFDDISRSSRYPIFLYYSETPDYPTSVTIDFTSSFTYLPEHLSDEFFDELQKMPNTVTKIDFSKIHTRETWQRLVFLFALPNHIEEVEFGLNFFSNTGVADGITPDEFIAFVRLFPKNFKKAIVDPYMFKDFTSKQLRAVGLALPNGVQLQANNKYNHKGEVEQYYDKFEEILQYTQPYRQEVYNQLRALNHRQPLLQTT